MFKTTWNYIYITIMIICRWNKSWKCSIILNVGKFKWTSAETLKIIHYLYLLTYQKQFNQRLQEERWSAGLYDLVQNSISTSFEIYSLLTFGGKAIYWHFFGIRRSYYKSSKKFSCITRLHHTINLEVTKQLKDASVQRYK